MYFSEFPKIRYKFDTSKQYSTLVTNIMFRLGIWDAMKNNAFAYNYYIIREGERPDAIAEKFYGNPEYHWIIFLANNMVDPLSMWPKDYLSFNNFLISKYGSVPNAQETIHHYQQVINRTDNVTNTTNTFTVEVDLPTYQSLPENSYEAFNLIDGSTIVQTTSTNIVYCYDFEDQINEQRRSIKLIKKEYLASILQEFAAATTALQGLKSGTRTLLL